MVVCAATTNIHTATAATTTVDPVPSCIPQWSGWDPRDLDNSGTLLDCCEVSVSWGSCKIEWRRKHIDHRRKGTGISSGTHQNYVTINCSCINNTRVIISERLGCVLQCKMRLWMCVNALSLTRLMYVTRVRREWQPVLATRAYPVSTVSTLQHVSRSMWHCHHYPQHPH